MSEVITAIYEEGVLKPLQDIGLEEKQWVRLKVKPTSPETARAQEESTKYLDSKAVPGLIAKLELLGETELVTSSPDILQGIPVIAGTRVPAYVVLRHFSDGDSVADILLEYPSLPRQRLERLYEIIVGTASETLGRETRVKF